MQGIRRLLPLLAWLTALGVGIAAFHHLGTGALAPPPLLEPSQWPAWADEREPLQVVIALLRLVVLAVAWYLVGVTTVGLVARLSQVAGLIRLTDALTLPVVRRGLQAVLGLSLATAVVGAAVTVPVQLGPGPSAPVAAGLGDERALGPEVLHTGAPSTPGAPEADRGAVAQTDETGSGDQAAHGHAPRVDPDPASSGDVLDPLPLELLVPPEPAETSSLPTEPAADPDVVAAPDVVTTPELTPEPTPMAQTAGVAEQPYVVVAGDSLWLIAARTLEQHWSRAPLDVEVASYWQQVIDTNRSRLADPEVPDLIFPDQELILPEVPAPPADARPDTRADVTSDTTSDTTADAAAVDNTSAVR